MVVPGYKFEITCFSAAIIAEILKLTGRNQHGASYVYEVVRPWLRNMISRISQEEYEEMMRLANLFWGSITTWTGNYLNNNAPDG